MKRVIIPTLNTNQEDDNSKLKIISYDSNGNPFSYYSDDKWIIMKESVYLNFKNLTGDFKSKCKELIYNEFNSNRLINKKGIGTKYIQAFVLFEKCITECGGNSISYLNSDKGFRNFILVAKKKKLKLKTWKNYLIIFPLLNDDGVLTRKIENANALAVILASEANITQQTMALPENIALCYFKSALDVVSKYHPYRNKISEAYRLFITNYENNIKNGHDVPTARRYAQKSNIHHFDSIDFTLDLTGQWLSRLRGACYIVIAGFTGCRDGEIKSFNLDSYQEKKYAGMTIPILHGVHTKPNIAGVARNASWVTIPAVKDAIELVWCAYEFVREMWKERATALTHIEEQNKMIRDADNLFLSYSPTATYAAAGRQAIDKSLKSFVKSTGYVASAKDIKEFELLNPTRKGELKLGQVLIPNPHCFRRTFAVYLVRNKLASLLELKYQFKHMNIAMTSWYSNQANVAGYFDMMLDKELKMDIAQENHDFMTDTLYYIYNEAESLSGIEGKRIMSLRGEDKSSIYLSREEISQQVKNGQMSIIETPVGHCTNPQCNRICDMPECKYEVITKKTALSLVSRHQLLIHKFEQLVAHGVKIPNILSKIYYDIKSMEKCFDEHKITVKKFTHDINVTLL
ncbi:site-specific integrase [Photobacterium leiognathi]|uniref:site-specific integrase n=1 Tax=Photobacterium leiognathi TaxID=553611 RepID=UPI002980FA64|nr:site-specific integrase [Photobacterium leiognathi]